MALDTDRFKKFARLSLAKKKLKAKHDSIGRDLDKMMPQLIEDLINEEVDKISLKGGITVFIRPQIWPKWKTEDKRKRVEALKEAGFKDLVEEGFNTNSLAAILRELDATGKDLPEVLKEVLEANTVEKLIAVRY